MFHLHINLVFIGPLFFKGGKKADSQSATILSQAAANGTKYPSCLIFVSKTSDTSNIQIENTKTYIQLATMVETAKATEQ